MAQTIKLKRSNTSGATPTTSQLELGEVAINTYDGKMYIKKNDGTEAVVEIGDHASAGYITDGNTNWNNTYGFITNTSGTSKGANQTYVASSTSTSNRGNYGAGVWSYSGYSTGGNRPFTYDATLQVMANSVMGFELSTDWHSSSGQLKIRSLRDCCQGWSDYSTVWTSASDGSGSGLDADLLDGQHGSYYYPASNPNGYTSNVGDITAVAAGSGLGGGGTSGTVTVNVGAGDGIDTTVNTVAVDSTVIRTTGNQTLGGIKTFSSEIVATGGLTGTTATFSGNAQVGGALRITEAGTAQNLLMGNQDSGGTNKPAMIMGVNGYLRFGHGSSWSGEGGTFTEKLRVDNDTDVISGNFQIGSTTVIDSNRNLTNIGTISSGAITSTGQSFLGSTTGITGSSTDTTANVSYLAFYESDKTTRQGYVGYGSTGNTSLYLTNDVSNSDILFRIDGATRATFASSGNATFTGTVTATGGNSTNWNTAYGWGNHASAGYITGNQTITLTGDVTGSGTTSITTTAAVPSAPSITATSVVGETIEVTFSQSSTSGVDHYEVWSDGGSSTDYSLVARVPEEDIASSMSIVDSSFDAGGTIAYRAYAVKNGVYSTAATASRAYTVSTSLDVSSLSVVPDTNVYHINYNKPASRFIDHIEIYKDAEAVQGNLSRTGAALVYSGANSAFTYSIGASDLDKYHQFWVEVVAV